MQALVIATAPSGPRYHATLKFSECTYLTAPGRSGNFDLLRFGLPSALCQPTPPGPELHSCQPSSWPTQLYPRSKRLVGTPSTVRLWSNMFAPRTKVALVRVEPELLPAAPPHRRLAAPALRPRRGSRARARTTEGRRLRRPSSGCSCRCCNVPQPGARDGRGSGGGSKVGRQQQHNQ